MSGPDSLQVSRFRDWIAGRLGLRFEDSQLGELGSILALRATRRALPHVAYLDELYQAVPNSELEALVGELTVPETYFFRHVEQYRAYADVALPAAQRARGAEHPLKILSVGCASGEEPYSLVMWARDHGGWRVEVCALDINPAVLAKAARGLYTSWALRETPSDVQQRWFRAVGNNFALDPQVLGAVQFERMNLAQEHTDFWTPGRFDVIFCRNVLMYFTPEIARAAVARMTQALIPNGYFFLGHAETMRNLSSEYELCHSHEAFYYQRKGALSARGHGLHQAAPARAAPVPTDLSSGDARGWPDIIRHSTDRVQALHALQGRSDPSPASAARTAPLPLAGPTQNALDLLRKERFGEALALMNRLPPDRALDTEALLLRAALLMHNGRLADAEQISRQLLERDEANAGAHYLLALCRENAGDLPGASKHDAAAISIDAQFGMPRLHLGLMARRGGDLNGARSLLQEAMPLLEHENDVRLLLFGGGFGRNGLIALCRAELQAAERPA